ncbi:ATP-binding protein [Muricauda sp. SCSIO 64092]|uniref:ATP-binding protein n=1 Tax=Allomuricauda sp. SCSIO 64092 TaxID=2908842 RepID=UPI001FF13A8E|nr:ATP-binding protein [Muricauda sp. SCSIO 64092]UOY08307.1 ATP-binding protein [Muricauda sp. SCSIO 64092]
MAQFRTKARAVDLLGKGQIADLPTAITELWKNGYDAYADRLTAEIYLPGYKDTKTPLFLITDDGKGMSRKDIFEKWLVLGTDSKSRSDSSDNKSEQTLWKKPRVKAGEKGIGRLSVAYLGSPMLMLTKKIGHPLQALYFDWRLLENYNLFLDDVQISVCDINTQAEFHNAIMTLRDEFLKNFELMEDVDGNPIWEKSQNVLRDSIIQDSKKLSIPSYLDNELLEGMLNPKNDHGTTFIIFNPEQQILELIDDDPDSIGKEVLRSSLVGFTNQFKKNPLPIETAFPVHKEIGNDYDFFTSSGKFFEPEDFELGDILIEGDFDGTSSFKGTVKIYDDEPLDYSFTNSRKKDSRSNYGPFSLKLGYSMGLESESKLEKNVWNKLKKRIEDYGGLYIYRDGFRVLPYGRTEYDFLEFERKRALKAGESFFSHRRMFGYIELSRNKNSQLKDKAGREGLISNAAYRAFKSDLEGLFNGLAQQYFGSHAKDKSFFVDRKKQLKEQHEEIKKDKAREKAEKNAFTKSLKEYPEKFEDYNKQYQSLLDELDQKIKVANVVYSEIEELLDKINRLDVKYDELLPKVPKRYKPTETQLDRLASYESKLRDFDKIIKSQRATIYKEVEKKLAVQELKKEFEKSYHLYRSDLEDSMYKSKERLQAKLSSLMHEYGERSGRITRELDFEKNKLISEIETKEDVVAAIEKVKAKFAFLRQQVTKELLPLSEHVERLNFDIDEELLQGAYKAEYENIKYQWEQTRETAQLGIAVEIIDHEFNILYSQINASLKKLDENLSSKDSVPYRQLKKAFSQLEDKYQLLSPLYRVSGATPKDVTGKSIDAYLRKFFTSKLEEEGITLSSTEDFKQHSLTIKEPSIHTVYINIINNAVYWLRNVEKKHIKLDYNPKTKEVLIINSGSIIEDHRLERIFELFYSNRPNGRGIGLYLAKQSLQEAYYDIFATNDPAYNVLGGACFVIKPSKS